MIHIKGGRVIDPANGIDKRGDVFIQSGRIVEAAEFTGKRATIIDAKGKLVVPGLIDMHVHLREPGHEYKETVASGCDAAAAGGFTSVVCMPNTDPVCDNASIVAFIRKQAERANGVNVFPMGAVSKGLSGDELAEMGEMLKAGAVAFTDDGKGIMRSDIMRSALEYAENFGVVVCAHAEDHTLSAGGCMHEGYMSTRLGLSGVPAVAESVMVSRDIQLAAFTGGRYHVQHISTREAVELVRQAKKAGLHVTAEAAPHHWSLSDADLEDYDPNFKMNPPLRSEEHVKAVRRGLKDGTIDVIATDHAPHSELEKLVEFDQAANGIIGLETALPLGLELVRDGVLDLPGLVAKLTVNPARVLGLEKGTLSPGADGDVTIIDPELSWVFSREEIRSKSANSPWLEREFTGRAVCTIAGGRIVYQI